MATKISDAEWDALASKGFDTTALLRAIDVIGRMRSYLGDGETGAPSDLRTDVLQLHQLAMDVFNQDARGQVAAQPAGKLLGDDAVVEKERQNKARFQLVDSSG